MTSITSIIVLGVLPIMRTAPVLEEGALWILGESNSSDETCMILIGSETNYSSFSCENLEDGVYQDPVSCSLHYR
ncbi:hypothetical protein C0J52_17524 [Blattella germanica]|nr:hypothetical protein C0J52_17524 [Blattella germanica]